MTRFAAGLAAIIAFAATILAAVAFAPYALGLLYGCFPPEGRCGDGVGWAMIISTPLTIPVTLIMAALVAVFVYRAVVRAGESN